MNWFGAAVAAIVAVAIVLVPGLLATVPVRLRGIDRVAASALAGIVCLGAAGIFGHLLGLSFAPWQSLAVALLAGSILAAGRRLLRGEWLPRPDPPKGGSLLGVGASWFGSTVLVALTAFSGVGSPARFSQTYDNVFHLSAVVRILETGDASSLTLRTMIETGKQIAVYPSGWHSLVAATVRLAGVDVPTAANAAWLAVIAAAWLPGSAWLARVLVRGSSATLVAVVALPLAASFGAFPAALLAWGTLYPTFLATAMLPGALAAIIVATRAAVTSADHPAWHRAVAVVAVAVAVAAVAIGQPRVVATLGVLLMPLVVWRVIVLAHREWRQGGARRRRVIAYAFAAVAAFLGLAVVASWYLVVKIGLFSRPLDDRLGGPQAKAVQSIATGLVQVVGQSWLLGEGSRATWPALLLAFVVIVGAIVCWRQRRLRWLVLSYVVIAVLFALAAGSDDVVTKLATGLWYKDRYRLSSALPIAGVVLATVGVLAIARALQRRLPTARRGRDTGFTLIVTSVAWVVAISSTVALVFGGMSGAIGRVFEMPASHATTQIASRAQLDFLRGVRDIVPAGQRALADPWGGSTLVWLEAGREPVFPHVNGQWDAQRQVLATRLQDIRTDPAVCRALDDLRVRYVLFNPHQLAGGDPAGNLFPAPNAAVRAGLFTQVATDGETSLYRIDECGPLR